ncbi:MAG: hypothetical protein ABR548_01025 [Actinomycetota bacterium]|nr:hypothetical protein [Actinomycetota bacterium]
MALFRRKLEAPELIDARIAFDELARALDAAQRMLLLAVPTSRHPGAPLSEALDSFEAGIGEVVRLMPGWRTRSTEVLWKTCELALATSRAEAAALRSKRPGPTEFEALNARIGDVLAPLEHFADAERFIKGRRM